MLGVDFTQPFQRKGRPGAGFCSAQQTFQTIALVGLDAHLCIDRETAAVFHSAITCACCADSRPRRRTERSSRRRTAA